MRVMTLRRGAVVAAVLLAGWAAWAWVGVATAGSSARAAAAAAAPPEKLTLRDLVGRPDRWPAEVTLKKGADFANAKLPAGHKVTILEFAHASEMGVDAGNNLIFALPPEDCDVLEAANVAWGKLTPEQRALEPATVIADASLWPAKVRCTTGFMLEGGKELPPGGEYELASIDRLGKVTLWHAEGKARLSAGLAQTDTVARARQLLATDPAKRPSRVAAALGKARVDADGKPVSDDGLDAQTVFALYYGASWCGPCRTFSPGFVDYVNKVSAANPKLTVVLVSADKADADMLTYMKEEKMPWSAVPMKAASENPLLTSYMRGSIPQLTIVDRYGKVLADSWTGNTYAGPKQALAGLDKTLKAGAAK